MASRIDQVKTRQETITCSCPACLGLQCLERPRYFAGQLLTEAELNSEQAYVLAKNRLHNRYLHGWGVVCGLQVVCHECEGWVTVKQGYAIDPCGNDTVVCEDHDLDVIKRIRECRDARRRRRRAECEPLRSATEEACEDVEEHWCLTIAYEEKEARPIMALRRERAEVCGCRCGGNGSHCGCRCHSDQEEKASYTRASTRVQSGVGKTVAPCEPTRIFEGYRLDVVEAPADHCRDLKTALEDTLLSKVMKCLTTVGEFIGRRVPTKDMTVLRSAFFTTGPIAGAPPASPVGTPTVTPATMYDAYCRLRQAIRDLYVENPFNVRCALLDTLDQIDCPPPRPNDTLAEYITTVRTPLYDLTALLLQYVLDCICQALLPPCPPDPEDDRLILACLTIKNDKIIRICNFSCRRHAGAFPSVNHWLSLVPVIPLLGQIVTQICCHPGLLRRQSPLVNDLLNLLNRVDPSGSLREAIFAKDFALPRTYLSKVTETLNKVSVAGLAEFIRPGEVNLTTLVGKSPEQVKATCAEYGVTVVWREVGSADEVPARKLLTTPPFASRGDRVVLYRTADKVVGFARYEAREELAEKAGELEAVKKDLDTLRSEVDALKRTGQARSRRRR